MIGYVTLGTRDLKRAATFCDRVLATLGGARFMEQDRLIAWASSPNQAAVCIALPYDGEPATAGNGTMVALAADSEERVRTVHAEALAAGASDEGEPGERMPGFYAAYFRDLDGNKLAVFFMNPSSS